MMKHSRWRSYAAFLVFALLSAIPCAHAASGVIVKTTPVVCTSLSGCQSVSLSPQTFQHIRITVPSAGTITVTINGSAYCYSGNISNPTTVNFESQIVPHAATAPSFAGPGGKRHTFTFPPSFPVFVYSGSSDLNAVRAFSVAAAGTHIYYYRHQATALDPGTSCSLHGGNMIATFVASP